MGIKMIKISAVYFVIGVFMGMYMSMGNDHSLTPAHTHLNLLGWVSLAIIGVIYHIFPAAAKSKLGKVHFWLHTIGVAVMTIGLAGAIKGVMALYAAVPVGATAVTIGVVLFVVNVMKNLRAE